jgi:glycosyltransferase involved in cell wall biosynthesis
MREVANRHFLEGEVQIVQQVVPSFRDDSRDASPDAAVLARLPSEPYILFVGALRRVKGIGVLLETYRRLVKPPPLVLIGTREIDTPSIPPGVHVLENMPHGTVMAAWDRALFGVFPSVWPEPFGNVIHEAMSRGRAVVGTTPGGHGDMIVDGESGLLVPAGDSDALLDAMQRLLDNSDERVRMGEMARVRAARFTAPEVMPLFEELYARVLGTAAGLSTASAGPSA